MGRALQPLPAHCFIRHCWIAVRLIAMDTTAIISLTRPLLFREIITRR